MQYAINTPQFRDNTRLMKSKAAQSKAWKTVQIARHPDRPQFLDYVGEIFTEFDALHGLSLIHI